MERFGIRRSEDNSRETLSKIFIYTHPLLMSGDDK